MKEKLIDYILSLPLWAKIVSIVIIALSCVVYFCSCSTLQQVMPTIKDNKVGAEGVVSKEKNVTKQTKWYFLPDDNQVSNH